jgi:hypothetical protein
VHTMIPFEQYKAIKAVHKSTLSEMTRSPAHYRWAVDNPSHKSTPTQLMGSLVHCLVLEPHRLYENYYVSETDVRRGTKAWDTLETVAAGRTILKASEYADAKAIADAVFAHAKASECLAACEAREATLVWNDPATELLCKARPDALSVQSQVIVDLKTTQSAADGDFARDVLSYKYHWQAAMYLDAARVVYGREFLFVFVAVEKEPPYGVGVYLLSQEFIELGRTQYQRALKQVAECETSGQWPCYSETAMELPAPAWAMKNE